MAKGIYEKLLRLMEAVDHIEKRGKNKAQNYDYLMAEDVINEVRQECIKEKLVIIPAATGQNVITSENKSGGTMFLTTVPMTFTICDVETGESIVVPWQGQGQDSGDKGIYKAYTGADKYFLRNLLLIPTGDDPENDGTPAKPKTQQPARQQAPTRPTAPPTLPQQPPQPQPNAPTPPAANPVTEADVNELLKERAKHDKGWETIAEALNVRGVAINGKTGDELKAIVVEALLKFSRGDFDALVKRVKALPFKSQANKPNQ